MVISVLLYILLFIRLTEENILFNEEKIEKRKTYIFNEENFEKKNEFLLKNKLLQTFGF